MSDYYPYPKRDPIKNYFPLPNEIFLLDLTPGELAVYSYLMRCEDRRTRVDSGGSLHTECRYEI